MDMVVAKKKAVEKKVVKKKKVLRKEDRPELEDVLMKVWALFKAYQYIIEGTSGFKSAVTLGLSELSESIIDEIQLSLYGEKIWRETD